MRIALLSYRSKPHCGGQGIYVRHLSRELVKLGHEVEVFSGQPYPELDEGVVLTKVPEPGSLPRARPVPYAAAERVPRLDRRRGVPDHVHGRVPRAEDVQLPGGEAAGRPRRRLRHRPRQPGARLRHPRDRADGPARWSPPSTTRSPSTGGSTSRQATTWRQKLTLRRWYGFLRMQTKVARQVPLDPDPLGVLARATSPATSGVDPARMRDHPARRRRRASCRRPRRGCRAGSWRWPAPTRPMKGIATLLEAFAKLRTERDVELVLVTKPEAGRAHREADRQARHRRARSRSSTASPTTSWSTVMGSAELACVPSLYEGFSLPTAELMACETPLVVSRAGAIPEVVGPDGECADLVDARRRRRAGARLAGAARRPRAAGPHGRAGRERVQELFSWRAVAATAAAYETRSTATVPSSRRTPC